MSSETFEEMGDEEESVVVPRVIFTREIAVVVCAVAKENGCLTIYTDAGLYIALMHSK